MGNLNVSDEARDVVMWDQRAVVQVAINTPAISRSQRYEITKSNVYHPRHSDVVQYPRNTSNSLFISNSPLCPYLSSVL